MEYKCKICGKRFVSRWALAGHGNTHSTKLSEALKGRVPWNKGRKGWATKSEEARQRMLTPLKKGRGWNKGTGALTLTCMNCGKTFTQNKHERSQKSNRVFCSQDCYHQYNRGEKHPRWNRVGVFCHVCGAKFYIMQYQYKKATRYYCSEACQKIGSKESHSIHNKKINKLVEKFNREGYKCVPVHALTPDAVAFKDGKVYAIELYRTNEPDMDKLNKLRNFFDEVLVFTD